MGDLMKQAFALVVLGSLALGLGCSQFSKKPVAAERTTASQMLTIAPPLYMGDCMRSSINGDLSPDKCPVVGCYLSESESVVGVMTLAPGRGRPEDCRPHPYSKPGARGCMIQGQIVPDGLPFKAYDCKGGEEMRTCVDGVLEGSMPYRTCE